MIFNPETPVNSIKPYDKNPRIITQEAIDAVAASIEAFGFLQPIEIDQNRVILSGHTRYLAAKKLGLATVPTVTKEMDAAHAAGYRIANNKTGELAQWDRSMLDAETISIMSECDSLVASMALSDWEVRRAQAIAEQAAAAQAPEVEDIELSAPEEISINKKFKPAERIPEEPMEGVPQILRSVLILDKPAQMDDFLAMLGCESVSQVPTSMHAAEAFKNV